MSVLFALSDTVWLAVIGLVGSAITVVGTIAIALINKLGVKMEVMHREQNGELKKWKEEAKIATEVAVVAAKAEGVKEEKERHEG